MTSTRCAVSPLSGDRRAEVSPLSGDRRHQCVVTHEALTGAFAAALYESSQGVGRSPQTPLRLAALVGLPPSLRSVAIDLRGGDEAEAASVVATVLDAQLRAGRHPETQGVGAVSQRCGIGAVK
jgi:hypothetical protein